MCPLKSQMSQVLLNASSVKVFFGTKTLGAAPPSLEYKSLSCSRHAASIKIAM